ncbi:MAG: EAL domain-containing protein [Proteobacteria bacterium]|nr:EAL domain-containing protein [Pseudomonadota bacterium]
MINPFEKSTNRILIVDDDKMLIDEYLRCLGEDFEPDCVTSTLADLEKVLFGEDTSEKGTVNFNVQTTDQGAAAVKAVAGAVRNQLPFAIVFLDIRMPPGIDGIEAAKKIRAIDPDVNIVIVSGSTSARIDNLNIEIPPADKVFFFKKPFHAIECRQLAAALCGKWHSDLALRRANDDLERRVEERTTELHRLAYYDPVTRLPNQLLLLDELQALIDDAEHTVGNSVVVLLDINRFSFLNETMGYDSGTELLRSIGNRLSRMFCDDKRDSRAVVGRFGADEFAVLMPGIKNDMVMEDVSEQVKRAVEEPFLIDGRDIFLKTSIGVAAHPANGCDAKSIFRCAEAALHRSMRSPQHAITYYNSEMQYRAQHRFDLESEFRNALDDGQITAFYQPQQSTITGELAGVEALARWIRPDGRIVSPADFVPLSEEMGISDRLFETILREVCSNIAAWQSNGAWDVPVSVNLSAHQLRNADLVKLIKQILRSENVDRKLINLELTETALLEDLEIARPVLNDLNAYGIGIHIDDFGTGYSSLSYLAELPVQTLKIDRSFIANLTKSDTNARVVQAIIALARVLELNVVAEGIETSKQYAILRQLKCELVQGYFIAKPMPPDEFQRWCAGNEETQNLNRRSAVVDIDNARN